MVRWLPARAPEARAIPTSNDGSTTTAAEAAEALPFDPDALREKYRQERDKRLRPDGNDQYIQVKGRFAHFLDDPYGDPTYTRAPLSDEVEVVVIGGGFGGLLAGVRFQRGVDATRHRPRGVDAFLGESLDDLLAELAQRDSVTQRLGVLLEEAADVALRRVVVHPEEEVGGREVEEGEGVRLHELGAVEQLAMARRDAHLSLIHI